MTTGTYTPFNGDDETVGIGVFDDDEDDITPVLTMAP